METFFLKSFQLKKCSNVLHYFVFLTWFCLGVDLVASSKAEGIALQHSNYFLTSGMLTAMIKIHVLAQALELSSEINWNSFTLFRPHKSFGKWTQHTIKCTTPVLLVVLQWMNCRVRIVCSLTSTWYKSRKNHGLINYISVYLAVQTLISCNCRAHQVKFSFS